MAPVWAAEQKLLESSLMRECAPLYSSFALESLWTLILAAFFTYLSVLISSKQQLQSPGKAVWRFVCHHFKDWFNDTWRILKRWDTMHTCDMGQRFRFCRRLNATICRVQVAAALLAVTRWLHINNVNGFRYLGYAFTCPLMQAELILLIAPAVPCYKLNVVFTMMVTLGIMLMGWYTANVEGDLWTTDFEDVFINRNFQNLTDKGTYILPHFCAVLFLSFVQIPWLALMYNCADPRNMPEGYNRMLVLTSISWLGFPVWWMLSYEGASVITDTKLNGFGFMMLNIIAKGGFTLCMISMVKNFKRKQAAANPSPRPRSGSVCSVESLPPLPGDEPEPAARKERQLPTAQSLVWMINGLRAFDGDEEDGQAGGQAPSVEPTRGSELKNEDLVAELMRRLGISVDSAAFEVSGDLGPGKVGADFESALNRELASACLKFVDEESDEN
jgi:bacteriorhodopsin